MILRNKGVRLALAPSFGCRWTRLQVRLGGTWTDLLAPVRSLRKLRRDPFFYGAFLMAPWCNRIPKGRFTYRGERHRVRTNFPDGSAIHGDAWGRRWRVVRHGRSSFEAVLDSRHTRDFNFPWPVIVRHGVRLTADGVSAWLSVTNPGREPFPAGVGFHPFFRRALRRDAMTLEIPPRRGRSVVQHEFDEGYRLIGRPVRMTYGDVKVSVSLRPGQNARELYVWAPRRFRGRATDFACVEPMTMRVGDVNRGRARVLRPGATRTIGWAVAARTI